jgi:CheY-specific phosphatase CheX
MRAFELAPLVSQCCSEILEAMYFTAVLRPELDHPAPGEALDGAIPLAFSLCFAGDVTGRFGVSLSPDTARILAANFLGEEAADISSAEVGEVTGELANMFCGSVMSQVEGEHKFILSHPEPAPLPCAGTDNLLVSRLLTDSGEVTVWVAIEGD